MDWESKLITLYLTICKHYSEHLEYSCERFTNGPNIYFTDEEVITIYFYGLFRGYRTIKSIHAYTRDHLKPYFPQLPGYHAFVHRVKKVTPGFTLILNLISEELAADIDFYYLADSFPITVARHQHAYTANTAREYCSKSFCSTKKMHYYGVRAHVIAKSCRGTLPSLDCLFVEEARRQDGPVFDQMRYGVGDNLLFGDQAYKRRDAKQIEKTQELKVLTPVTKKPGKELEHEEKVFSKAVSKMRQPIEALFGWIQKVTGIENASTVRSGPALMAHIFGRFAAAMMLRKNPQFGF